MPMALAHPLTVNHRIEIHLPEPWTVTSENVDVSTDAFIYSYKTTYSDKVISIDHSLRTLTDHVEPADVKTHVQKIDDARGNLTYSVSYTSGDQQGDEANVPFIIIALVTCGLFFLALKKLFTFDPRARNYSVSYEQVGGLLILPMIGLFISPLSAFAALFRNTYFKNISWRILTDSAFGLYDPSRGTLIVLELLFQIFSIAGAIFLLILMMKRRTSFPLLMIVFLAIRILFVMIDSVWVSVLDNTKPFAIAEIVNIAIVGLWILYFIYSDRVKGTFRERLT